MLSIKRSPPKACCDSEISRHLAQHVHPFDKPASILSLWRIATLCCGSWAGGWRAILTWFFDFNGNSELQTKQMLIYRDRKSSHYLQIKFNGFLITSQCEGVCLQCGGKILIADYTGQLAEALLNIN